MGDGRLVVRHVSLGETLGTVGGDKELLRLHVQVIPAFAHVALECLGDSEVEMR